MLAVDQSLHVVCPPSRARPVGLVLLLQLHRVVSGVVEVIDDRPRSTVAWTTFPLCQPGFVLFGFEFLVMASVPTMQA
jgi:hypothetical protein